MIIVKPSTVVVLSLLAASLQVLAIPYDSYQTYPTSVETTSATSTSDSNDESSNKDSLSSLQDGLQRVWEGITCMGDCRQTWGWTGNHFGSDPWGGVLQAGDPMPYVAPDSNANGITSGTASGTSAVATPTSSAGAFGIQDVTTTTSQTAVSSVAFSVFNAPTLQIATSTASSTTSSTSSSPTTTTFPQTTTTPEPSPPEPQTTEQQQQQQPSDNTTDTPNQPAPTNNSDGTSPAALFASPADQAFFISAHNDARAAHGASPVTWSNTLEGFAHEWATNCQFQHSGGKFGRVGENLAAGTGNYGFADAMAGWMAEITQYDPSAPVASHFTQVVWKGTSQIGCAKAVCGGIFPGFGYANFFVCEYLAAGNVIGQFAANVQK